jgi:putative oxidoreductase
MKVLAIICRVLLGLMFLVFGLNGFLHFIPMGPPPPAGSLLSDFFTAMVGSGWMKWVAGFQVLGGLLVLSGVTAPLGLVILCPITVNILLFHMLLAGGHGILPGLITALLELILIAAYWPHFAGVCSTKAKTI